MIERTPNRVRLLLIERPAGLAAVELDIAYDLLRSVRILPADGFGARLLDSIDAVRVKAVEDPATILRWMGRDAGHVSVADAKSALGSLVQFNDFWKRALPLLGSLPEFAKEGGGATARWHLQDPSTDETVLLRRFEHRFEGARSDGERLKAVRDHLPLARNSPAVTRWLDASDLSGLHASLLAVVAVATISGDESALKLLGERPVDGSSFAGLPDAEAQRVALRLLKRRGHDSMTEVLSRLIMEQSLSAESVLDLLALAELPDRAALASTFVQSATDVDQPARRRSVLRVLRVARAASGPVAAALRDSLARAASTAETPSRIRAQFAAARLLVGISDRGDDPATVASLLALLMENPSALTGEEASESKTLDAVRALLVDRLAVTIQARFAKVDGLLLPMVAAVTQFATQVERPGLASDPRFKLAADAGLRLAALERSVNPIPPLGLPDLTRRLDSQELAILLQRAVVEGGAFVAADEINQIIEDRASLLRQIGELKQRMDDPADLLRRIDLVEPEIRARVELETGVLLEVLDRVRGGLGRLASLSVRAAETGPACDDSARALDELLRTAGLEWIGHVGERTLFDPTKHQSSDLVPPGAPVTIVRRGVIARKNGVPVVLERAGATPRGTHGGVDER